jgi:hypothetical protein
MPQYQSLDSGERGKFRLDENARGREVFCGSVERLLAQIGEASGLTVVVSLKTTQVLRRVVAPGTIMSAASACSR